MKESEFQELEIAILAMAAELESDFPASGSFDKVLRGIRIIRGDAIADIKKLTGFGYAKLRTDLDRLLNPVFHSDQKAIAAMERLVKDKRYCFFIEKGYQVSNAHGIFDHHLQKQGVITDYYLLQLFADHFETVTQRLKCLLRDYHGVRAIMGDSTEVYKVLENKIPEAILNSWVIPKKVITLRNAVNHGSSIAKQVGIQYLPNGARNPKVLKWNECRETIDFIIAYSILLATEIDYRFFKLAKSKPEMRSSFVSFFNMYKTGFFKGQNAN